MLTLMLKVLRRLLIETSLQNFLHASEPAVNQEDLAFLRIKGDSITEDQYTRLVQTIESGDAVRMEDGIGIQISASLDLPQFRSSPEREMKLTVLDKQGTVIFKDGNSPGKLFTLSAKLKEKLEKVDVKSLPRHHENRWKL